MPDPTPTSLSLALTYLRTSTAWTQTRLARWLGISKESISQYERGAKPLTRERVDSLVEAFAPPEAVDVLLVAYDLMFPDGPDEAPSPVALSAEELGGINRATMVVACLAAQRAAEDCRAGLILRRKEEKRNAARQEAQEQWVRLKAVSRQDRLDLVAVFPEFWNWALAERVNHESERMAAHKVEEALELADLALSIAERVSGDESWRFRLQGYCWAHVANARRVANDHAGADEAFACAWDFWRAGAKSDTDLLAEWRLLDLEASLRRDQRRFSESLELLDQARAASGKDPLAVGRILLKKEHVFDEMGDPQSALAALMEAAPFVEASSDARLTFVYRFKIANNVNQLGRYHEAAQMLAGVRHLAVQLGNELDLLRVVWLESKIAAAQGRTKDAIAGLEQVGRDFSARELPYDAALSSLDLSVLWLEAGRTAEVREQAIAMNWIFRTKGIDREVLAALKLFCDAACQDSATVELARQVSAEIKQARRSAPPASKGRGRG